MTYRVSLSLRNPRPTGADFVIEEGTIFEVAEPTKDAAQTLAATQTHSFHLGPGETAPFEIDTVCLNLERRAPRNDPMRLTLFIRRR